MGVNMNQNHFVDFYEILQISSNADLETIERIYRLFAKRYHPDNTISGNADKFNSITEAYRLLSDPEKRAAYDAKYEDEKIRQYKILSHMSPSDGSDTDNRIRNQILSILYVQRRREPFESSVGLWQIEKLLGMPEKILEFHIWYLKEKGYIQLSEAGGYAITASGVDVAEENDLILGRDRLLPEPGEISESSEASMNNKRTAFLKVIQASSPQIFPGIF